MSLVTELKGVCFSYGDKQVLCELSAHGSSGEMVCVLGANGSGKSTLLRLIAGLLTASRGSVETFGADPSKQTRPELAKKLAYTPQDYFQPFPFTALDLVLMGRYANRPRSPFDRDRDSDREAAHGALSTCDADHLAGRTFDTLSGGERRRVLLAQAICQSPELILLDEPTASLDPAHAFHFMTALSRQKEKGLAAWVVTHDLNLALHFADRILLLKEGRELATASPAEIMGEGLLENAFDTQFHRGHSDNRPFAVPTGRRT